MKEFKSIIAKVLGIDVNSINDDTSPSTVETWDSFNALLLVTELEENYKVSFTMDEVIAVKCVRDIKNCLKKHGISIDE